jgi:phosphoglycerate dehydrogenase-like enzyme
MPKKILIIHQPAEDYARVLRAECPEATIIALAEETHASRVLPDAARAHLADADAIVSIGRWINADIVAACRQLKWFQCLITGTDHINDLIRGRGVVLTNARGIHGTQMSELAIVFMLAHMRQIPRLVRSQAAHHWDRFTPRVLKGHTVVIVGVGTIAEDVATLCKAFGMRTIGISRTPRPARGFDTVLSRDDMLAGVGEGDFVVLLLPLTDENRGLVGREFLAAMKPEASLINISRGNIVDEEALIEALGAGRIAFAGLDVFKTTPLPADSPFWGMENVFVTPHTGGRSDRYEDDAVKIVSRNLRSFIEDRIDQMINVVPL